MNRRKNADGSAHLTLACAECGKSPLATLDQFWFKDMWVCGECHHRLAQAQLLAVQEAARSKREAASKPIPVDEYRQLQVDTARALHLHKWVWLRVEPGQERLAIRHVDGPPDIEPARPARDVFFCSECYEDSPVVRRVAVP